MPLTLDDLEFNQLSFELRFTPCFRMWDCAGRIWEEAIRLFPKLNVTGAVPNKIAMREDPFEISVEPNRLGVQAFEPLKHYPRITGEFTDAVSSILELQEFTRIGLRLIHTKSFPSKEEAAAEVMKCGLLKIPDGKHFGVSGLPLNPEVSFRKEEGGKGYLFRIKADGAEYKLDLPYFWHKFAKSISEVHEMLSFDVDSYVQGTILRSQVSIEDWITQALHAIRRDANIFLGA